MKINFTHSAWQDYLFWQKNDRKIVKRINQLIEDICRHPYSGIGKPEALKYDLQGYYSRRINSEHRIIYTAEGKEITIISVRFHYK